jgi:NAD(P)-dependent dehydrogenase (short-subunit alcohol dehydrogenase family)
MTEKRETQMPGKLEGKIALVTGGSSGIGLATAQQFVKEGAYVYITGRRQSELDKAVKAIGGSQVKAVRADSSKLADLDRLFTQIKQEKGRLDVVFANAGGGSLAPLGSITEEVYDQTFNTNVKGVLFTVQKALPLIPDGGSIILNASIVSQKGMAAFSVYSATKAAVRSFARGWTTDLKDRNIRVNAISPGPIDTPILDGLGETEEERKGIKAHLTSQVPLGRMGQPDEIGKAAVFLASQDSSFVAGVELFVDGGMAQV